MFVCVLTLCAWRIAQAAFPGFDKIGDILPDIPDLPEISKIPNPMNLIYQNKCIEDLGCFFTGPPFYHPLNRPISLTPTSNLYTKFWLYTPSTVREQELIVATKKSIDNSAFDPKLPIKVLIHGFRSDLEGDDIRFPIKDALFNESDYNVIIVDWTEMNGPPYAQAVANTRVVGAQIAQLLNFLIEYKNVNPQNIHIIGHSLGGQTAGYAGERIQNLGRITGLDPAGPYFQNAENAVRLDATDALFVDIIHSDGGENVIDGLGIGDPVGHMDFYPNGGRRQPGCVYASKNDNAVGAVVNYTTQWVLTGCDHERANKYFLESIDNSKCRFLAVWCNSYDDFEKGDCLPQNSTMSEMGLHAKRIPGVPMKSKFFLRTNPESPFCNEDSVLL